MRLYGLSHTPVEKAMWGPDSLSQMRTVTPTFLSQVQMSSLACKLVLEGLLGTDEWQGRSLLLDISTGNDSGARGCCGCTQFGRCVYQQWDQIFSCSCVCPFLGPEFTVFFSLGQNSWEIDSSHSKSGHEMCQLQDGRCDIT